jgi:hypothetical protein
MTLYEQKFGRPVPDGFKEVTICMGCGFSTSERDCDCPAGNGYILVHALDGHRLSDEEKLLHYRELGVEPSPLGSET